MSTDDVRNTIDLIRTEIGKAVVGQNAVIEQILVALLADGHVLLEGVPGIAKTLTVRALAQSLDAKYSRIQFTPDLMPSDVTGTNVYSPSTGEFNLRRGPIFTNILLADEINRTPPKTQSALLEAMEERQVTIDGESHILPEPFMVLATQNPIEYEGTYPLPEAQLDRFMLKILVDYPLVEEEHEILSLYNRGFQPLRLKEAGIMAATDLERIQNCRRQVSQVRVDDPVRDYICQITRRTRDNRSLILGASPRATINLMLASKALAAIRGREFVTPDDVKDMATPVLRHRIILRPESEIEGLTPDRIIASDLAKIEVPR